MMPSRTNNIRLIKMVGVIIFSGIVIIYAFFRILNYARGPAIIITEPENGITTSINTIIIRGQALRINKLTINGNPITTDEQGFWSHEIIVFEGLNKITIVAEDQFGRSTNRGLDIVGKM